MNANNTRSLHSFSVVVTFISKTFTSEVKYKRADGKAQIDISLIERYKKNAARNTVSD
jgi:hypothetical protein